MSAENPASVVLLWGEAKAGPDVYRIDGASPAAFIAWLVGLIEGGATLMMPGGGLVVTIRSVVRGR